MKRAVGWLLGAFFLVGCAGGGTTEDTTDAGVAVDTTIVEDTSAEEGTSADTSEADSGSATGTSGRNGPSNGQGEDDTASQILFVPQKSDIEAGLTVENDEALRMLEQLVLEADENELGVEEDVAIHFTGLYLDNAESKDAIFLIVNRTDMAMTNVESELSFGSADGEMVMDRTPVQLPEDSFGVLEPNTAMPLYITVDTGKEEVLLNIIETRNETLSIDSFTYQEINSETQDISNTRGSRGTAPDTGDTTVTSGSETDAPHEIVLVPQESDIEAGFTVETDETLSQLQQLLNNTEEVGIEGDVAIHNSGLYLEYPEGLSAVFVIVNRTPVAMKNIKMDISFSSNGGTVFLDEKSYHLSEQSFGVLEPNTAMPLYFTIPVELTDQFLAIEDIQATDYSIDSFDFEEK
ncbi:hypothetical protein [Atopococcus tabaci]|uniref:hypothetical protein n=1 Tax=Atopococcus tabaci TaxID=269774 RepID=UPI002409C5C1|nr:hypothetical protein [Atopococcus tabaci]